MNQHEMGHASVPEQAQPGTAACAEPPHIAPLTILVGLCVALTACDDGGGDEATAAARVAAVVSVNRLLWTDNSTLPGDTRIQASATSGSAATTTAVISALTLNIDGLQINSAGNLLAIDARTGAKLINLATGAPGTVTNLTDGAACATTVTLYKADAWCSDSRGKVIGLLGAGNL